ncbi:hypothetical protein BDZ89DRAFT_1130936 [Hymenopellis radicata]|nr:hypothetical protein BDZ89DRAFT_1130936 [Hymenopellis radicata]
MECFHYALRWNSDSIEISPVGSDVVVGMLATMGSLSEYDSEAEASSDKEALVTYPDIDILNDEYELVGMGPHLLTYPDDDDSGDYVQVHTPSDESRSDTYGNDSTREYGASTVDEESSSESDKEAYNGGYRRDSFVCSDSEVVYESSEDSGHASRTGSVEPRTIEHRAGGYKRKSNVIEREDEGDIVTVCALGDEHVSKKTRSYHLHSNDKEGF